MTHKQTISVKVLETTDDALYNSDHHRCELELSATVAGKEYSVHATWNDMTGLALSPVSQFQNLIDGKKRAILATRKDYLEQRFQAAFDVNVWNASMATATVEYDTTTGNAI